MEFLKKFNLKTSSVLKIVGLAILAIVILVVAFRLIGSSFNSVLKKTGIYNISSQGVPSYDYTEDAISSTKYSGGNSISLSERNVVTSPSIAPTYQNNGTTGDTAEEFEVTEYNATIETRQLNNTCATITDLKKLEYVIFENANEYNHGCNYVFKVKHDKVSDILGIIKNMNPKELSENTYTIKKLVDDFTSRIDILKKKLSSIDETMRKAVNAYDDITLLATKVQDVESLAKIIDSKINIIERLTQERININAQLEQIQRSKTEQLDRLEYTYFRININENKFIDEQNIKDSWKAVIKGFVTDVNKFIQDVTVNLVVILLFILQYAIYLLILLIVAKYGWKLAKYIWKK
ncbi:MAG: hypothetical protein WC933_02625 [Candidatus Paceibacterota bacterium]|jgi:hypothetical protein